MKRDLVLWTIVVILLAAVMSAPGYCSYAEKSNQYLTVRMGIADTDPFNSVPGRFSFSTVAGDPETPDDDNAELIYASALSPMDGYGYNLLHIADLNFNAIVGTDAGVWTQAPMAGTTDQYSQYIRSEWKSDSGAILVKSRIDLRRDVARMEYTLINQDTVSHQVGFRAHYDIWCFGDENVKEVVPGRVLLPVETEFLGSNVPAWLDHFDNITAPVLNSRHIFRSANPREIKDPTPPDRVVIGEWGLLAGSLWDYTVVPDRPLGDTATDAWWNPITLAPNRSRVIVVYFGMGVASSDYRPPTVLSTQSRQALIYDSTSASGLTPDPLVATAYLYNLYHTTPLTAPHFLITLPDGLELAPGETPSKSVPGNINAEQEAKVTWNLQPTGDVCGELQYSVTAGAGSMGAAKTVTRSITVPATRSTRMTAGVQMMSIPFDFADPIPSAVFASPSLHPYRYDPDAGSYVPVDTIRRGEAFWISSATAQTITLSGATPSQGTEEFAIDMRPGWNQIGNPNVYDVSWGQTRILNPATDAGPVTTDEAVKRGWIKPTLYWYDVYTNAYKTASSPLQKLHPYVGYWLKVVVPCQLVMPPIAQVGGAIITSELPAPEPSQQDQARTRSILSTSPSYSKLPVR